MAHFDWDSRSNLDEKYSKNNGRCWIQHLGACTASLSAFAVGNALGWSSPSGPQLLKGAAGFPVSDEQNALIGSLLTIGAAVSCLPAGYITDKIGRKLTLLGLVPIFTLGWGLIIWANSVGLLYAGRFLLGLCVGTACVTAPVYVAEICQKEIRGTLGCYFQLLLAGGILFSYVIGSQVQVFWFSLICGLFPTIFGVTFVFIPESPVYYLTRGRRGDAKKSLVFFRGRDYDPEPELFELSEHSDRESQGNESIVEVFNSKPGIRSLLMSIGMMIFQQICGINAFSFNATDIFDHAGSTLDSSYETMIIGVMQVVGTLFATFLVDRLGRVILLGTSACFMAVCTFFLGVYFYSQENNIEMDDFSFLPLLCLCVFIVMFSVGYGPVPWMVMPELIPSRIKGLSSSIACTANWLSAFIVTESFSNLVNTFGRGITFWMFTGTCSLAAVYSFKILPETKGRSFEEIQRQLR